MKTTKLMLIGMIFLASVSIAYAENVVFSEVLVNADGSDPGKEFIELYNPTDSDVDIGGWKINFKSSSVQFSKTIPDGSVMPANGFFLITNNPESAWPSEWADPDARLTYVSLTNSGMGLQLEDSSDNIIDRLGWGPSSPIPDYFEAFPLDEQTFNSGNSLERKPGFQDAGCGNWIDTNNNVNDFLNNPNPEPQNSLSSTEEPCQTVDNTPPSSISNLQVANLTNATITWEWSNPSDPDFFENIIFINGLNLLNDTTDTAFVFGLDPDAEYTITVHTKDAAGNVNDTDINDTARTLANGIECNTDSECDDNMFCNGQETCNLATNKCESGEEAVCGDGLFCNGQETCNEDTDSCDAGTPPAVDDGISCTVDSCNEIDDVIEHNPDNSFCDNGLFCDGKETCDEALGCMAGSPVACDDGLFCNGQETCDEITDSCNPGMPIDCSMNDLPEVSACNFNPDSNPLTHDSAPAFNSTCNELTDSCTTINSTLTHTCSIAVCGAACETDADCAVNEICDLNSCGCIISGDNFCGDNLVAGDEICDGTDLNGSSCRDFGFSNPGSLSCKNDCSGFNVSSCLAVCGDGNIEPGEQCDDNNLDNGDGCSSTCVVEIEDDLMINYLRGKITYDGVNAENGTKYQVDIISGENSGKNYMGFVDDENVLQKNNGNFDTADQLIFSTGDMFSLAAENCSDVHESLFANGGNESILLDCRIPPKISSVQHVPKKPTDLDNITISADVTDNLNIDKVILHYAVNGNNFSKEMTPNSSYKTIIEALPSGSLVEYHIFANDTYGSSAVSDVFNFDVLSFIEGDVTKDGMVDIDDLILLIKAFGKRDTDPDWDESFDLIRDGEIDISDIIVVISNFG